MRGRAVTLCLALVVGLCAGPAFAVPVQIDFTIAFAPNPPPIFQDLQLTGTARFGELAPTDIPTLVPNPPPISLDIGSLSPGGSFTRTLSQPTPALVTARAPSASALPA